MNALPWRWTVAAFTTSPGLLACIQPLHGLTFALFHLAAIRLIVTVAPVRLAATAQAIYGTLCEPRRVCRQGASRTPLVADRR